MLLLAVACLVRLELEVGPGEIQHSKQAVVLLELERVQAPELE